jgi:hypothetical protein
VSGRLDRHGFRVVHDQEEGRVDTGSERHQALDADSIRGSGIPETSAVRLIRTVGMARLWHERRAAEQSVEPGREIGERESGVGKIEAMGPA